MSARYRPLVPVARWCRRGLVPLSIVALVVLVMAPFSIGDRSDQARICAGQVVARLEDIPRQAAPETDIGSCASLLDNRAQGEAANRRSPVKFHAIYLKVARMLSSLPRDAGGSRDARTW